MLSIVKTIALAAIIGFGNPTERGKAKADFARMNEAFLAERFSVEMHYNYYEEQSAHVPSETKSGIFYRKGNVDYSNIQNIETLHTPEMTVVADHEDRLITISAPAAGRSPLAATVDTLLSFCKDIRFTNLGNGKGKYELLFRQNAEVDYLRLELLFDMHSYYLEQFTFFFRDVEKTDENGKISTIHPKMEVIYSNFNKVALNSRVLNSATYITKTPENKFKGSGTYSAYKVYNQKLK